MPHLQQLRTIRLRFTRATVILCGVLTLSSCTVLVGPSVERDRAELEHNWRVWRLRGSTSYSYVQQRLCYCVTESLAAVSVTVRNGSVMQRRYWESGTSVPVTLAPLWGTVEDLFHLVDDALQQGASSLHVTYHPTLGYPTHIAIDYRAGVADDELTVTASRLTFSASGG